MVAGWRVDAARRRRCSWMLPAPALEVGEPPRGQHEQKPTVSTRPSPVRLLTRAVNTTGSVSWPPNGVRITTLIGETPFDRATIVDRDLGRGVRWQLDDRSLAGNVSLSDSRWTCTVNVVADVFVRRSGIVASRPPTVNENGSGGTTEARSGRGRRSTPSINTLAAGSADAGGERRSQGRRPTAAASGRRAGSIVDTSAIRKRGRRRRERVRRGRPAARRRGRR